MPIKPTAGTATAPLRQSTATVCTVSPLSVRLFWYAVSMEQSSNTAVMVISPLSGAVMPLPAILESAAMTFSKLSADSASASADVTPSSLRARLASSLKF